MEVTVIGAGPAGLFVSQYLNKAGYKVNIIEEHKTIGKPIACSGLIGSDFFKHFKNFDFNDSIINRIDGAKICFRNDCFELKRKGVSYVVNREIFDQSFSKGLEVSLGEKFLSFERNNDSILVKTNKRSFNTELLIGADGPASRVRNQDFKFNLKYFKGYQVRMVSNLDLENFVHVHIERPFFNWIIPEGNNIFRIGTVSDNPKESLNNFLAKNKIKGELLEVQAGVIPIGNGRIYHDRVFLLGDAACQVKPLSGGGVYYGALAAEILANSIISGNYDDYTKNCNKLIGKEISRGLFLRKIYENLSDKELSELFDFAKSKEKFLNETGIFDEHYKTILSLVKDPKIIKFLPVILRTFF